MKRKRPFLPLTLLWTLWLVLLPLTRATAADAAQGGMEKRVAACVACHKLEGQVTRDGYFPRIAGKPEGYLFNQLQNFRDGRRQYPPMTWMVSQLSDAYLREIAHYFSNVHAPWPPAEQASLPATMLERGRTLATRGDQARQVPACAACHGERLTGVAPAIPAVIGLPRDYLNAQFGAWRNGSRRAAAPDCMATIASRLSNEDVLAVTAWLSAQPAPTDTAPASALPGKLPLACGSVGGAQQ